MKVSVLALWSAAAALLLVAQAPSAAEASHHGGAGLKLGYYKKTCPGVENVVKYHVAKAIKANRGAGAALVRLIFHDCFVRGCDASVLLDPTPANPETEKTAPINIGLAAFEVIDEIKAALEERCPGTVSCADIVVYAARDASIRADPQLPAQELHGGGAGDPVGRARRRRRPLLLVPRAPVGAAGADRAGVPEPAVGQVRGGGGRRRRPRGGQQRARRGPARRRGGLPVLPREAAQGQGLSGQQLLPQQP
uniref:Plant heme peroxidase family profile domain-containing protein n=1 Tax=Zea mays TaxID=4577 RepID=A0A804RJ48_MAIZE